ncbi:MAG: hypothetical protein OQK35_03160 [Alphaproteobacteria bacterium]|nr:hypothetical protein [Rhodospirillales bacterium]MCW9045310.1 hypothetical protein [Alphaproteobacteria bacterium]
MNRKQASPKSIPTELVDAAIGEVFAGNWWEGMSSAELMKIRTTVYEALLKEQPEEKETRKRDEQKAIEKFTSGQCVRNCAKHSPGTNGKPASGQDAPTGNASTKLRSQTGESATDRELRLHGAHTYARANSKSLG